MSVEYRSIACYGWIVSPEEVSILNEDVYEELMDSEKLILQDSWAGHSNYIFVAGNSAHRIDEGAILTVDKGDWPSWEELELDYRLFHSLFGRGTENIHFLVFQQVF